MTSLPNSKTAWPRTPQINNGAPSALTALTMAIATMLLPAAAHAGPKWVWEAGKQSSNGAITLKSTSSSATYSGTQNPTGNLAKTNQVAATQPPTVVIQTSGNRWSMYYQDRANGLP